MQKAHNRTALKYKPIYINYFSPSTRMLVCNYHGFLSLCKLPDLNDFLSMYIKA